MDTDTSYDVLQHFDQKTTISIERAISFSPDQQRELRVNFSRRNLLGNDHSSDDSMNEHEDVNENNVYMEHACDSDMNFPKFRSNFENDLWSPTSNMMNHFFVRKQTRSCWENDIQLQDLMKLVPNDNHEEKLWFHGTSWKSAIKKVEEGPQISHGPLDMAYHGAFYLNPDHHDCYEWFRTADSKFKGKHAMLIYKFHPESLSKKGKEVFNINKWRTLAGERSRSTGKFEDDWTYTYQCSNPDCIHRSGDNARIRKIRGDQDAKQLIIYTEKMCRKIHNCLIGCVYYENLYLSNVILDQV